MFLPAYIFVLYECLHTFIPSPWCKSDTTLVALVVFGSPLRHSLAFSSPIPRVFHIQTRRVSGWSVVFNAQSHRQRGHLGTAPPFTVPCEGREAQVFTPYPLGIEPQAVAWQSITHLLSI